jgi:AraC family transcriptional activator of mtrCDE
MLTFDQLCRGLEVGVSAFATCEVRQDSAFVLAEEVNTAVHYVLAGEGVAYRSTGNGIAISPHTILIVPPGASLTIASNPERRFEFAEPKCEPLTQEWDSLIVGEAGPGLTLACGFADARYMQVTELFSYLRQPLIESIVDDRSVREPFHNLLQELAEPKPGTRVLAEMLMKQCLIALLRGQSENSGECFVPWLAALGDPALGRAMAAMTDNPQINHTLGSLGDIAGMSRSAFSERFRGAFGRTAIDCLKEIRLRRAAHLLATTELPVKTVAYKVGFESRSYFSRAFKEFCGLDPVGYRANPVASALNNHQLKLVGSIETVETVLF